MTDERLEFGTYGLRNSITRFKNIKLTTSSSPEGFHAVEAAALECLWWCQMLNERLEKTVETYREARALNPMGSTVQGLRYARNRYTHSPVIAIERVGGLSFPAAFPVSFGLRAVWRAAKHLGTDKRVSSDQEKAYVRSVQGRDVVSTLEIALQWFTDWVATGNR
ncbi:hypothetical protein [Nesterenkonia haasae]|uniref:hypothetical protein n=1 Tax=Nesterenkonia haasae TaxID=2587813 RepID=UPI0013909899|nr:hypothetical protein [Nesterenkonia haasae]NDK33025.1 hypothetical protein [Nesterenkonia haasae]